MKCQKNSPTNGCGPNRSILCEMTCKKLSKSRRGGSAQKMSPTIRCCLFMMYRQSKEVFFNNQYFSDLYKMAINISTFHNHKGLLTQSHKQIIEIAHTSVQMSFGYFVVFLVSGSIFCNNY